MNNKSFAQKILFLTVLIIPAGVVFIGTVSAATLTVDASGGAEYTSIQAAINMSAAGDTVLVYSGTYYENINVTKRLILTGVDNGGGQPVIDGGALSDSDVVAFSANGIIFEGFTVINGHWGISIVNYGDSIVRSNNIHSNRFQSMVLDSSSNNVIMNNTMSSNYYGISLWFGSNNNTLLGNTFSNTTTYSGVYIVRSSGNTVRGNTMNSNRRGISLYKSDNNTLSSNIIISNTNAGLSLAQSFNNSIYDNYFNNSNNSLFDNGSINRWNIARTAGNNVAGGPYIGGNFWAYPNGTGYSQTCADADTDRICDLPYALGTDFDYLPLTTNYTNAPVSGTVGASVIEAGGSPAIPAGYGKYQSEVLDAGRNVSFITVNPVGTGINQAQVYTAYSVDGTIWSNWTQTIANADGLYAVASGQYGRYFGYIIIAPPGVVVTQTIINYIESPEGVIYIT